MGEDEEKKKPKPLSIEARRERLPQRPENIIAANQDVGHTDLTGCRGVFAPRYKRKGLVFKKVVGDLEKLPRWKQNIIVEDGDKKNYKN